jgi:hypothetical protein
MYHFKPEHPNHRVTHQDAGKMTREQLIAWLMWNDRNGIYDDHLSLLEHGEIMTYENALEHVLRQIGG